MSCPLTSKYQLVWISKTPLSISTSSPMASVPKRPSVVNAAMKSPSAFAALSLVLCGSRPIMTSHASHMWSPSVSQWQGFVPIRYSS